MFMIKLLIISTFFFLLYEILCGQRPNQG